MSASGRRPPPVEADAASPAPTTPVEGEASGHRDGLDDALLAGWCRRIRDGDSGALEAVFRNLREPLLRSVTRLLGGDVAAAHDVVQETFVRLWSHRSELDPRRSLAGWLHRTARNLALNRVRDVGNREELLASREAPRPTRPERPDEALYRREFARAVEAWVAELPARQQEALRLTRFQGLSHQEAAEAMGCSPRTVNNHLVRALRALRERIDEFAAI